MKKLSGIVVPIVTPLTEKDKIDVEGTQKLTEHCISGGLNCLYPCGTTGEMMYLKVDERKLVAETVIKQANGRVPVFVHVGAWNSADTIQLAKHAVDSGADGIGVVTPAFFKLSEHDIVNYFVSVAESVPRDFPVYLYGIPQNAVNDLTPSCCEMVIKACPNVIGAKYSFPDFTRLQQLMLVNSESFSVLAGPDHWLEPFYAAGGEGTVSGNAMILCEHYVALWNALKKGQYDRAKKLQRRTNLLNSVLMAQNNIAAYKVILKEEGVIQSAKTRPPMGMLSPEDENTLKMKLNQLKYKEVRV